MASVTLFFRYNREQLEHVLSNALYVRYEEYFKTTNVNQSYSHAKFSMPQGYFFFKIKPFITWICNRGHGERKTSGIEEEGRKEREK